MVLGRRLKHKLPKFPPNVTPLFRQLCSVATSEEIGILREEIRQSLEQIRTSAEEDRLIDLDKAEKLASTCYFLLDIYEDFGNEHKSLIVGAVRYFSCIEDPLPEEHFATGFNDDCQIVNHVLEQLGIEGRFLDLD